MKTFEDYYVKKDYSNALTYLQEHSKDIPTDLWHYNLGTTYARLSQFPSARYHLLKSAQQGFNTPSLTQNLDFVEEKLEVTKLEKSLDLGDYLHKTGMLFEGEILTTLSLLCLIAGLLALKQKRSFLRAALLLVLTLLPLGVNYWISHWPRALVIRATAVFEGPSAIFEGQNEVPAGVLIITNGSGEWRQILYPSRFGGWVKSKDLKEL